MCDHMTTTHGKVFYGTKGATTDGAVSVSEAGWRFSKIERISTAILAFSFVCVTVCVSWSYMFHKLMEIARLMRHLAFVFVTLVITHSSFFENALSSYCLPGNAMSNSSSIMGSIRGAARWLNTKIMGIGVDPRLLERFVLRSAGSTGDQRSRGRGHVGTHPHLMELADFAIRMLLSRKEIHFIVSGSFQDALSCDCNNTKNALSSCCLPGNAMSNSSSIMGSIRGAAR